MYQNYGCPWVTHQDGEVQENEFYKNCWGHLGDSVVDLDDHFKVNPRYLKVEKLETKIKEEVKGRVSDPQVRIEKLESELSR